MKRAVIVFVTVMFAGAGAAVTATIQPSSPSDITLDSANGYTVFKQFDGTASTDATSYQWNLVGSDQTDTGPTANFTFDRDSSSSNTITLTTSNGTHTATDEVTQVIHDVPQIDSTSHSPSSPSTGATVTFSATTTNSFDGPLNYSWTYSGTTKYGESVNFTFSSSGTQTVDLTIEDKAGNTASASESVDVQSSDGGGGGGGSTSGGTSGGGGGGGFALPQQASVELARANGTLTATIRNVQANTVVSVRIFRNMTDDESGVGVDSIDIGVSTGGSFQVDVSSSRERPAAAAPLNVGNSTAALGYLSIDHSWTSDSVANGTIRFRVNRSLIQTNPNNVRLYRYDGGVAGEGWQELETVPVDASERYRVFEAETPGFSTFAVAELRPNISVVNAALDSTKVNAGGTVSATVTLRNTGDVFGEHTLTFTVGGQSTSRSVRVNADARKQVTLSVDAPDKGVYDASVNGASIGSVNVTTDSKGPTKDGERTGLPWTLIVILFLLLVLGGVVYAFRDEISEMLAALGGEDDDGFSQELGPVRTDRKEDEW